VGAGLTRTETVETEDTHGEFEMVQAKTFIPIPIPLIGVFGKSDW